MQVGVPLLLNLALAETCTCEDLLDIKVPKTLGRRG
jgi:hypothetical protein